MHKPIEAPFTVYEAEVLIKHISRVKAGDMGGGEEAKALLGALLTIKLRYKDHELSGD
jgi:hypothetical protein